MITQKCEKNFFKNFPKKIKIAQTVLNYTFFLESAKEIKPPKDSSQIEIINAWIDEIFNETHKYCKDCTKHEKSFFLINTHGTKAYSKVDNFAFFDRETSFWKFILKQEAILFSYAKIRELIGNNNTSNATKFCYLLAPYDSDKKKLRRGDRYGLYSYYKERKSLNKIFAKPTFDGYEDSEEYEDIPEKYYSMSGNLVKQSKALFKDLNQNFILDCLYDHENFDFKYYQDYRILIQANTLEFNQYTLGRKDSDGKIISIKPIINAHKTENFSKHNFFNYYNAYRKIIEELKIPGLDNIDENILSENCKLELADKIYCRYQLEKIFSFSTIDCLYQNLYNPLSYGNRILQIEDLANCFLLPNALSRHFILQMAVDAFQCKYDKPVEENPRIAVSLLETTPDEIDTFEHHRIWRNRYLNMIDLLYKFVIPIYNNYFFVTLWDSISSIDKNDSSYIEKAFVYLSEYLNNNENVKNLFSLENLIKDNRDFIFTYDEPKIINPFSIDYAPNISINYELYFNCIQASNSLLNANNFYYDYLNFEYLSELDKNITENIQKTFRDTIKNPL